MVNRRGRILQQVWICIQYLFCHPKFYIAFFLLFLVTLTLYGDMCQFLAAAQERVQIFEPFIFSLNSRHYKVILTLLLILLLGDGPFFPSNYTNSLIRLGRTKWFAAQSLYAAVVIVLYLVFAQLVFMMIGFGHFDTSNQWSTVIQRAALKNLSSETLGISLSFNFPIDVLDVGKPVPLFFLSLFFAFLLYFLVALIFMTFNLYRVPGCGLAIVGGLMALGYAIDNGILSKALTVASPFSLAGISSLPFSRNSLLYTFMFYITLYLFLLVIVMRKLKTLDIIVCESER